MTMTEQWRPRDNLEPELSADAAIPIAAATFMPCKRVASGAELDPRQLNRRLRLSQLFHLSIVRWVPLHRLLGCILESGSRRNSWFDSLH